MNVIFKMHLINILNYTLLLFQKESCWADKTPLETGLILILIVATPFLVTLILIYILFPILCADCSIACSKVCRPPSNSRQLIPPPPFPGGK